MNPYSKLVAMLSSEFNKYLIQHPKTAERIPEGALVIFQIEGETAFNEWSKKISIKNREKDQPVIFVYVKKWREIPSVEELVVESSPMDEMGREA